MNISNNFKVASVNAADLFGTLAAASAGTAPVTAASAAASGATASGLPPATAGAAPAPASPRFAYAMGTAVHASGPPAASAAPKKNEPEPLDAAAAASTPALPQEAALPAMLASWLPVPTIAVPPAVSAQPDAALTTPAAATSAPAAVAPLSPVVAPVATLAVAASSGKPAAAVADAAPQRDTPAAAPREMAEPATLNLAVLPAAVPFNTQLRRVMPTAELGEPLAAAMPPAAGSSKPDMRGKNAQDAVEAAAAPVQPVLAAPVIATTMPAAAASFVPGLAPVPAAPATGKPAAGAVAPVAAAATLAAGDVVAADATADVRPAVRPPVAPADAAGLPARASAASAPFTATLASAAGAADAEPGTGSGHAAAAAAATPAASLGLAAAATAGALPAQGGDVVKLNGTAQQWQEPLREALGERLQAQIGRNSEHAVIRLDPPMLGRIDISIRHTAGTLQVNVAASNPEVLRQLQGIGENMRTDLAQRQYTDVAVTISATPRSPAAQAFAEGDARGQRQPGRQHDDAEPGRALSDESLSGAPYGSTYAMHEREYN